MMRGTVPFDRSVEHWSPPLFLVAGVLLVGHAAVTGIDSFTNLSTPPDVFLTVGHLVALGGLVGLYPALADRTPKTARLAVVVSVIPLVGWTVMTAVQFLVAAGVVASLAEALPGTLIMLVVGSTIFTYGLFGGAALRSSGGSRTIGLLLVAPATLLVVLLVDSAVTGISAVDGVVIAAGMAASMLVLGYRLRTWIHPAEPTAPVSDATTG